MTSAMMDWLSPNAMHALGWALVHFIWQGTALAAVAAVAMALCSRASARYVVGVSALALMLVAPLATFLFYAQPSAIAAYTGKSSPLVSVTWPTASANSAGIASSVVLRNSPRLDAIPWLVEAWLFGVAFFSLRSAGGFLLLERERRRQSSILPARVLEVCYTLQDQLGIRRAIQYCECKWLQAPAVVGWFRPIVFLPVSALTGLSEDQLQAVIAHVLGSNSLHAHRDQLVCIGVQALFLKTANVSRSNVLDLQRNKRIDTQVGETYRLHAVDVGRGIGRSRGLGRSRASRRWFRIRSSFRCRLSCILRCGTGRRLRAGTRPG